MTKVSAVIDGAVAYAEHELLPKLNALHRFTAAMYLGMFKADPKYIASVLEHPFISVPKLVSDDGCVDFDSLYAVARDYVSRTPVNITWQKVTISLQPQDIDKLYTYVKEADNER